MGRIFASSIVIISMMFASVCYGQRKYIWQFVTFAFQYMPNSFKTQIHTYTNGLAYCVIDILLNQFPVTCSGCFVILLMFRTCTTCFTLH